MPSQKTASTIKCEVHRSIGVPLSDEDKKKAERRARTKGLKADLTGLTTMISPNKPVLSQDGKTKIPGEPVFVELDEEAAKKLQAAGAVSVVI